MDKIRVMIVDDSTVIRRLLSDALAADPQIEVVGTAANGKLALSKLATLKPDLVTLDIEMPEMDGLETLLEIRKINPKLPIIMFSTLTERGASATIEALARGATDYVTKPSNVGSVAAAIQAVQQELIPKIKAFCKRSLFTTSNPVVPIRSATGVGLTQPSLNNSRPKRVDAIVIGSSTGGPNALSTFIPKLPPSLAVPVFIVQHMPPVFTARLAERLDQLSPLRVCEATNNMIVEPGKVYLAPGNFHMVVRRQGTNTMVSLNQDTPECSCRPAVDTLFRSAANVYAGNLVSVILTGMGQDGTKGCEIIRKAGGYVIAQDEASSVVWGMPGSVTRAGLAQQVVPLDQLGTEISMLLSSNRVARLQSPTGV